MYRNLLQKAGRNIAKDGAENCKRWERVLQKAGASIAEAVIVQGIYPPRGEHIYPPW
ncbi:hypothetical protein JCM10003_120 [Bacteroides pyogenes JCM 10003]|nr:hypothetical protein JCM10003_120 [Bacteroides pyogenes JCM 10003]